MKIEFTDQETEVLIKLIHTDEVQMTIGGGDWDLTDEDEMILWEIIERTGE